MYLYEKVAVSFCAIFIQDFLVLFGISKFRQGVSWDGNSHKNSPLEKSHPIKNTHPEGLNSLGFRQKVSVPKNAKNY